MAQQGDPSEDVEPDDIRLTIEDREPEDLEGLCRTGQSIIDFESVYPDWIRRRTEHLRCLDSWTILRRTELDIILDRLDVTAFPVLDGRLLMPIKAMDPDSHLTMKVTNENGATIPHLVREDERSLIAYGLVAKTPDYEGSDDNDFDDEATVIVTIDHPIAGVASIPRQGEESANLLDEDGLAAVAQICYEELYPDGPQLLHVQRGFFADAGQVDPTTHDTCVRVKDILSVASTADGDWMEWRELVDDMKRRWIVLAAVDISTDGTEPVHVKLSVEHEEVTAPHTLEQRPVLASGWSNRYIKNRRWHTRSSRLLRIPLARFLRRISLFDSYEVAYPVEQLTRCVSFHISMTSPPGTYIHAASLRGNVFILDDATPVDDRSELAVDELVEPDNLQWQDWFEELSVMRTNLRRRLARINGAAKERDRDLWNVLHVIALAALFPFRVMWRALGSDDSGVIYQTVVPTPEAEPDQVPDEEVWEARPGRSVPISVFQDDPYPDLAHVHVTRKEHWTEVDKESTRFRALLRPTTVGGMRSGWYASIFATVTLLWAALGPYATEGVEDRSDAITTVLLVGPTLIAMMVIRHGEHALAKRVLVWFRARLVAQMAAAYVAAGVYAWGWPPESSKVVLIGNELSGLRAALLVAALISLTCTAITSLSYLSSWLWFREWRRNEARDTAKEIQEVSPDVS